MKKNSVLAWHFLRKDMKLGHGDGRRVTIGKTLKCTDRPISPGHYGLHASLKVLDTLKYADYQPILCRVRVGGKRIYANSNCNPGVHPRDADKLVAEKRTCLWYVDARGAMRLLPFVMAHKEMLGEWNSSNADSYTRRRLTSNARILARILGHFIGNRYDNSYDYDEVNLQWSELNKFFMSRGKLTGYARSALHYSAVSAARGVVELASSSTHKAEVSKEFRRLIGLARRGKLENEFERVKRDLTNFSKRRPR